MQLRNDRDSYPADLVQKKCIKRDDLQRSVKIERWQCLQVATTGMDHYGSVHLLCVWECLQQAGFATTNQLFRPSDDAKLLKILYEDTNLLLSN